VEFSGFIVAVVANGASADISDVINDDDERSAADVIRRDVINMAAAPAPGGGGATTTVWVAVSGVFSQQAGVRRAVEVQDR